MKPLIEATHRTNRRDLVLGESLAGPFVVKTYLSEPSLFDSYGAVDPSLWWDKEALSKSAARTAGPRQRDRAIFVAIAKKQLADADAYTRLVETLRAAKLKPCLARRPDQTHATIYQQVAPMALQYLLPPKEPALAEYGFAATCSVDF